MTRARHDEIEAAERGLPIGEFVESALRASVTERFAWPAATAAVRRSGGLTPELT